jgi:hypothetical protein
MEKPLPEILLISPFNREGIKTKSRYGLFCNRISEGLLIFPQMHRLREKSNSTGTDVMRPSNNTDGSAFNEIF